MEIKVDVQRLLDILDTEEGGQLYGQMKETDTITKVNIRYGYVTFTIEEES